MTLEEKPWKTAITQEKDGKTFVRGYDLMEMAKKLNFTQAIFLVLRGELPSPKEEKMFNTIFVSTIDHGISPPSVIAARAVASGGTPLSTAVAAGVMTFGEAHGGAIEQCAKMLQETVKKSTDLQKQAEKIVEKARFNRERLPGFGHRIYSTDPRTVTLLEVAKELGFYGKHVELALEIEKGLEKAVGKKLCLNVDGCIGAIISEMGFDWRVGKGFFIIGRAPGLVAHVFEELSTERPFRRLSEEETEYKGVAPRKLELKK
ncbi:MAG: citryl-CoA lyase [Candidatus Diapherotrites archaeon]|nr:citryl-CoA lyase [Candidatus Diapherotrites archaeon]